MRTSKELFQSSPQFKDFQAILANPAFEASCNAALMGMIESLPSEAADASRAWDSYLQILGARKFIYMLSQLHVPDEKPSEMKWPTLNYETSKRK